MSNQEHFFLEYIPAVFTSSKSTVSILALPYYFSRQPLNYKVETGSNLAKSEYIQLYAFSIELGCTHG